MEKEYLDTYNKRFDNQEYCKETEEAFISFHWAKIYNNIIYEKFP